MKRCSYCGRPNEDALTHCVSCGEPLPQLAPLLPGALTPESAAPETSPPVLAEKVEPDSLVFTQYFYAATPHVWVTYTLMGLNGLIFMLMGLESSNLVHPSLPALLDWGSNWGPLTVTGGGWWRLLAATFLHFTLFHLLCNMVALWQAGVLAERLFGNWFFLAVYLGTGLASSLTSLEWHPAIISAGASGAVFGVYGALLGYLVRQRGDVPRRIWVSLGKTIIAFVAFNLFYGLTQLQVDNAAHVGGLLAGLILGWAAARPLHLPHRKACTSRTAWQFTLALVVLVVPLAMLTPQANPGFGKLLNDMGERIAHGSDGPRDPAAAVWWYQRAARLGCAEAEFNLGLRFFENDSDVPLNPAEGIKWFRQAADHGSTNAVISLGMIYYHGNGVPADHAEARRWIARAAERGEPGEQFLLGQMDYQGDGTVKDDGAAFKWIHQAADQGLAAAQAQLATLYIKGEGTETNLVEAVRWAREAANHGQPNAQYILATLYATGQGVPLDKVEAYAWFTLAAGQPLPLGPAASNALAHLATEMTSQQVAGARHRADELTQKIAWLTRPATARP